MTPWLAVATGMNEWVGWSPVCLVCSRGQEQPHRGVPGESLSLVLSQLIKELVDQLTKEQTSY